MEEKKDLQLTMDTYIMGFSEEIQKVLQMVRTSIHEAIPEASEKISWGMPTFYWFGNLIHFAANKNHLGIYPGANGIEMFKDQIKEYKSSKGAVQFPYAKGIPYDLIKDMAKLCMAANQHEQELKMMQKTTKKMKKPC